MRVPGPSWPAWRLPSWRRWSRRTLLPALLASAWLVANAGCPAQPQEGSAGSEAALSSPPLPSARRPARRFYFGSSSGDTCMVYALEGATITPLEQLACPVDWERADRIRLSGATCFRESPGKVERPVVCPFPLLEAEGEDFARR